MYGLVQSNVVDQRMAESSKRMDNINPDDLHDLIVQVFVGEQIDMDAFSWTMGPDKAHRAWSIASDRFAAACFFHFAINTVLETLFSLRVWSGGRLESKMGVLGLLSAVGSAHGMRAEGGTSRVGRAAARAEGGMGMVRQDERKVERCRQAYER